MEFPENAVMPLYDHWKMLRGCALSGSKAAERSVVGFKTDLNKMTEPDFICGRYASAAVYETGYKIKIIFKNFHGSCFE